METGKPFNWEFTERVRVQTIEAHNKVVARIGGKCLCKICKENRQEVA